MKIKSRRLLLLLVVAVILSVLAHWTVQRRDTGREVARRIGAHVLPQLQDLEILNQTASVEIAWRENRPAPASPRRSAAANDEPAGERRTVTAERRNGGWGLRERYGYPVDPDKFFGLVRRLADLTVGQVVPYSERALESLHLFSPLDDDAADRSAGRLVTLRDDQGATLAELVVGREFVVEEAMDHALDTAAGYGRGRYVRSGDEIFMVSERFPMLPERPADWLADHLVDVSEEEIAAIRIMHPDQRDVVLKRPAPGEGLELQDLEPSEERHPTRVRAVAGVLNWLKCLDVVSPELSDEETGLDEPVVYEAMSRDGILYRLSVGDKVDGTRNRYARLQAERVEEDGREMARRPDPDAARADRPGDPDAQVEAVNARCNGWTYILHDFVVQNAVVSRDDLLDKSVPEMDEESKALSEIPELPDSEGDGTSEK